MVKLKEIVKYSNEYLKIQDFDDYCPNGMQVEGQEEVKQIVSAVSASYELFQKALSANAKLIIVHHGIIWTNKQETITGSTKKRLKILLENNISLLAYHLPLDAHPEIGNNIILAKKIGATNNINYFAKYKGNNIGIIASLNNKQPFNKIRKLIKNIIGNETVSYHFGKQYIQKIAIVTGGGQNNIKDAIKNNADLFITGEVSENIMHLAKEENINFIASGHYNTEKFGVQALGNKIKEKFNIKHSFIDIPNHI